MFGCNTETWCRRAGSISFRAFGRSFPVGHSFPLLARNVSAGRTVISGAGGSRLCQPGRDGTKNSLTPSILLGEDHLAPRLGGSAAGRHLMSNAMLAKVGRR